MSAKITLVGRLFEDPVVRYFENGGMITTFQMRIVNGLKKEDGDQYAPSDFYKVEVNKGQAENVGKYLRKGDFVVAMGNLALQSYNKKDGTKGHTLLVKYAEVQYDYSIIERGAKAESTTKPNTTDQDFDF